jgi:hypothetical protein
MPLDRMIETGLTSQPVLRWVLAMSVTAEGRIFVADGPRRDVRARDRMSQQAGNDLFSVTPICTRTP